MASLIDVVGHVNDPGIDVLEVLESDIVSEFPEKVLEEAVPDATDGESDLEGRYLREEIISTIDGADQATWRCCPYRAWKWQSWAGRPHRRCILPCQRRLWQWAKPSIGNLRLWPIAVPMPPEQRYLPPIPMWIAYPVGDHGDRDALGVRGHIPLLSLSLKTTFRDDSTAINDYHRWWSESWASS